MPARLIRYALGPAVVLALWWWTSASLSVPAILLPSPEAVLQAALAMTKSGELARHIAVSASRVVTGFAASAAAGVALGLLFARAPKVRQCLQLVVDALRVTPPLALIPLLILWLGIEEAPKVAVVILSGFFPIYLNTFTAVAGVDPRLKEVAESLRFTRSESFRLLVWPAALPGILTGLRLGFGYCWRALVGAELIAASSGLGFMISEAGEYVKTDCVFVGIITIVVLGIAADALLSNLVAAATPARSRR